MCKVTDFGLAVARGVYGYAAQARKVSTRNSPLVSPLVFRRLDLELLPNIGGDVLFHSDKF